MDTGIDSAIQHKIIALISALVPQATIYLFGSRARGKFSKWSDIDLALDAGKRLPISVVGEVKSVLENTDIMYKIDVVDFHFVDSDMQTSIKRECILWKLTNESSMNL